MSNLEGNLRFCKANCQENGPVSRRRGPICHDVGRFRSEDGGPGARLQAAIAEYVIAVRLSASFGTRRGGR